MSDEKFEYEASFVGRPARFDRFTKGEWLPVTEKEAKYLASKLDFKVRDLKGNLVDEAFFQARNAKEAAAAMQAYARREHEAERVQARTSLLPTGVKRGPVPHDEGYVPKEGELEAPDLPPVGFEIVEGAPKKAITGPLRSQRFDPSQAAEIGGLRLTPKDDPSAVLNAKAAISATQSELARQLKATPVHEISRA